MIRTALGFAIGWIVYTKEGNEFAKKAYKQMTKEISKTIKQEAK